MSTLLPASTISLLFKSYVRPTLEYACPVWMFCLTSCQKETLNTLQASAARAYLSAKNKRKVDWMTSKHILNQPSGWESLHWRRQILALVYFHHVVHYFPSLLDTFSITRSSSARRPFSFLLPKASLYIAKCSLFKLTIEWNKLPFELQSLPAKSFSIQIRHHYNAHKYSMDGIPYFGV